MGKKFGLVFLGLGVFLVAAALLSRFYAYDRLALVPIEGPEGISNEDPQLSSVSNGPDATIFDIATQKEITTDLVSTRNVVGQVDASEEASDALDRDIAIWDTLVYSDEPGATIDQENPPRSSNHDRVAFDRHTGEAIDCCGNYLSSTADLETGVEQKDTETPISGQYYKLPFDAQKKTYKFWDGALKDSTDLEYKATEEIQGVTVYKYEQVISPTDVADIDAPASFFGIDKKGNVTLDRIYSNTRTLWVEPETGVIFRGQEAQHVVAEYQGEEVATLTDVVIGYDQRTVDARVDEYSSQATQLKIVRVWLPLVGGLVGGVLIILGLVFVFRGRARGGQRIA